MRISMLNLSRCGREIGLSIFSALDVEASERSAIQDVISNWRQAVIQIKNVGSVLLLDGHVVNLVEHLALSDNPLVHDLKSRFFRVGAHQLHRAILDYSPIAGRVNTPSPEIRSADVHGPQRARGTWIGGLRNLVKF